MARLNKLNRILGEKGLHVSPDCEFVLPKKEAVISGFGFSVFSKACMHSGEIIVWPQSNN